MSQFSSAPGMPVVGGTNEQGSKTIREDLERSFRECLSLEKLQGNLFALLGSPYNIAIFVSYILISINSTLLIRNARGEDGTYPFHQTTVVIMVECVKICMASALYLKSHNWDVAAFKHALLNNKALFVKNAIPAILYGFYNNLTYFNLQNYDAAAFYILMQLKTALTGMMYKFAFKRNLSLIQWGTILSLTVGCSIKQFAEVGELDTDDAENKFFNRYLLTVLLQVFLGGLASVSIEYILKIDPDGSKGDLQLQNVFMYVHACVWRPCVCVCVCVCVCHHLIIQSSASIGPFLISCLFVCVCVYSGISTPSSST
jgi:drug/metabolite transporter (DMT)-like permease